MLMQTEFLKMLIFFCRRPDSRRLSPRDGSDGCGKTARARSLLAWSRFSETLGNACALFISRRALKMQSTLVAT